LSIQRKTQDNKKYLGVFLHFVPPNDGGTFNAETEVRIFFEVLGGQENTLLSGTLLAVYQDKAEKTEIKRMKGS
jgi:hypothetical protein